MRIVYGGGGLGLDGGYEIACVLSGEGDVGAWVLDGGTRSRVC